MSEAEARPRSGLGRDTMRLSSAQGSAVDGPTEANESRGSPTHTLFVGAKTAGQHGFGDFCRNKSHPR
ncbi:MAG: hypothetical protein ACE5HM_06780, partial [Acidiferrobacterales bacterium]